MEAEFRHLNGVIATGVGYAGGHTKNPTYEQVCSHTTGHAETVMVEFDPTRIRYADLLTTFWSQHNPTASLRPGGQYRSVIFYHTPAQKEEAVRSKMRLEAALKRPVNTEIVPAGAFYLAEDYHQQYDEKNGAGACRIGF